MFSSEPPDPWRLLWSPQAMAWYAQYRPLETLRSGSLSLGLWWGLIAGGYLIAASKPFAMPTHVFLLAFLTILLMTLGLLHGWTWLMRPTWFGDLRHVSEDALPAFIGLTIAAVPALVIAGPDMVFSGYRDAVYYAQFDPANRGWPPLPSLIDVTTQTNAWFFLGFGVWILFSGLTVWRLRQLPPPMARSVCRRCQYDLAGTLAAGACDCPECGQAGPQEARASKAARVDTDRIEIS